MSILLFEQWDKLVSLLQKIASGAAAEKSQYALNRVMPEGGHAKLMDRAMNNLTLNGEEVTLHVPDMIPGKAREFLLRVKAHGECSLVFDGTAVFEGEYGSLDSPLDGETVIYFFTETDADVFLVSRRIVSQIESE